MKVQFSFHRMLRLILLLILAVVPVLSAFQVQPALAADATTCSVRYTVKSGDTIQSIANFYGVSVNRLARTNNLVSPYTLTVGQSLCIPLFASGVKLVPEIYGTRLFLTGSGFANKTAVVVKARIADSGAWYRLGVVKVGSSGSFKTVYTLPKGLQNKLFVKVCLKDQRTDALFCRPAVYYK